MKKILALVLAFVLVIGASVAGTLAYLTDKTGSVTNTFTVGKVKIELYETDDNKETGNKVYGKQYDLIPGTTLDKNPIVEVKAESEACWLFVKFEEKNITSATKEWMQYTSLLAGPDWTQGDGTNIPSNVWYRQVADTNADQKWHLLKDDQIVLDGSKLTETTMPTEANKPELVYTAYACQYVGFESDAAGAWDEVPKA